MKITEEVTNEEVKQWTGVHLLYFWFSSCSQKVRVLLAEKGVEYTPHHVDLITCENATEWFLKINKRGVVPILVHDGDVYCESNDIMEYIETAFPSEAPFFPTSQEDKDFTRSTLSLEDSLHDAMRDLTFGFVLPKALAAKPANKLAEYESNGASDEGRASEVAWWRKYALEGVQPAAVKAAFERYSSAFQQLENRLKSNNTKYLCGDNMTIADIAWVININRMQLCGFPLDRYPRLNEYFSELRGRPSFTNALQLQMPVPIFRAVYQTWQRLTGSTLVQVANRA